MTIGKNFFYNSVLTLSNYIFPLLTFPYVTRILGVENIGICNLVDTIINFYVLIATLGVSAVGIREIAKSKLSINRECINDTFSSIFVFNALISIVAFIILVVSIYTIPYFYQYKAMLLIGSVKILSTLFLIEWVYKAFEDFRYITIRSIIVKSFYVISVFIFVKTVDDYIVYFALSVGMVVINAFVNWTYRKKHVSLSFVNLSLRKYIKPICSIGLYLLLTSMYTSFNVVYLGITSGEKEVGYYSTAIKLYTIILALFTAFTTVMLPRMSSLVAEEKFEELKHMTKISFNLLLSFCIPAIYLTVMLAPQIILMIAGVGYEGAIIPMRIIMPLILIIGMAQVLVIQILIPIKYDRAILINSMIGAGVSICLNILLVKSLGSIGSSVALLFSEISTTVFAAYFVYKKTGIKVPINTLFKHICVGIPYLLVGLMVFILIDSVSLAICVVMFFSILYFLVSQYYFIGNTILIRLISKYFKKGGNGNF